MLVSILLFEVYKLFNPLKILYVSSRHFVMFQLNTLHRTFAAFSHNDPELADNYYDLPLIEFFTESPETLARAMHGESIALDPPKTKAPIIILPAFMIR